MSNTGTNTPEESLREFRQLLDNVPFEQVISWVFAAPTPQRLSWWKRWWRS